MQHKQKIAHATTTATVKTVCTVSITKLALNLLEHDRSMTASLPASLT